MSKVLVLSDVHMKLELLDKVAQLLNRNPNWLCVSVGDLWDDWNRPLEDYEKFAKAWRKFLDKYGDRLYFCWGNHDYGYWSYPGHHSGYMADAKDIVRNTLTYMCLLMSERVQVTHFMDKAIFSHAGITPNLLEEYKAEIQKRIDRSFLEWINYDLSPERLWHEDSPLWHRPSDTYRKNTFNPSFLQVVGHTPMPTIVHTVEDHILYTDTWSTDSRHNLLGDKSLVVVETETPEWEIIPYGE